MKTHAQTIDLVQQLVRNRCVNEGTPDSGEEQRNAELLASHLEGAGLDLERYVSHPGRESLVTRIEGTDPDAPSLLLLGHTDVVPVNEERWSHDPFGGEIVDGELWGRGAIDMFNLTASMAVAVRRLADEGYRPRGTLIYAAVADEEAAGVYGAKHLADHETDAIRADYMITESGGFPLDAAEGTRLPVVVGERGTLASRLRVTGTPGHGSLPYGTDNALVKAAEVVRRLADFDPPTEISEGWRGFVSGLGFGDELTAPLLDPEQLDGMLPALPPAIAKVAYSCTHTTMTPTVMRGGEKRNVIPDSVDIELDVRLLAGYDATTVRDLVTTALGDLADDVEFVPGLEILASSSPTDTPLWDSMTRAAQRFYEGSALFPMLSPGATDARHLRPLGSHSYGFGIYSRRMPLETLATMAHGDDERIDVESLDMITDLWDALIHDVLD